MDYNDLTITLCDTATVNTQAFGCLRFDRACGRCCNVSAISAQNLYVVIRIVYPCVEHKCTSSVLTIVEWRLGL